MGMMIVSDEEFDKQIEPKPAPESKVVDIKSGRGVGKVEVPLPVKKMIAEESLQGAPSKLLTELFGVSPASVSAYKNDATSTASYNEPHPELKKSNDGVRDRISGEARTRLLKALEHITDDKLSEANLKTVASVAKDMSYIVKNMEPDFDKGGDINTQFVFYAPPLKSENEYDTINVTQ